MTLQPTRMVFEAAEVPALVARQLAANSQTLARLAETLRQSPPDAVLTCARGSSDNAATYARYMIESRMGLITASHAPSIASVYGTAPDASGALALFISQSGKSPDLLAAASMLKAAGARIASMVNVQGSPLADLADVAIPLLAGPELSVAATKSFVTSLTAIAQLVAKWDEDKALDDALAALPPALEAAWACDWSALVERLQNCTGLYVIGRGVGLGIAQEAALKFKESCGLHAEAFSAAEVRHGPMALVGPDFPLLVFRQSDETQDGVDDLVADVVARGGKVLIAGAEVEGATALPSIKSHPALEPILQIQSFYRAANALALARGLDPDHPPYLSKVTETI